MLRRLLALGGALVVLILIVLGVKGCLDARARGALSDYSRDVKQILVETGQTSKDFFGKLENPGQLSVTEFTGQVDADRSAMTNYKTRVEGLSAPGGLGNAQKSLELVYDAARLGDGHDRRRRCRPRWAKRARRGRRRRSPNRCRRCWPPTSSTNPSPVRKSTASSTTKA